MYCGDETGSFIGEIGSHTCKFGYGGEDNPKLTIPSYVVVNNNNNNNEKQQSKSKRYMSKSSLHAIQENQSMESILRMPQTDDDDDTTSQDISPITNPDSFLRQGDIVENWDNVQTVWEASMDTLHAKDTLKHTKGGTPYNNNNKASSDGKCIHPILAITPGYTEYYGYGQDYCSALRRKQYMEYTELLMETLSATSMFLAPTSMLSAFSFGRQTALVVDLGASGCRITPIVDGLVLQYSQRRNGRGGDWLSNITWKALLEETKINPKPRYLLRGNENTDNGDSLKQSIQSIFHRRAMNDLMYEVRTEPFITLCGMGSDRIRFPFLTNSGNSWKPTNNPGSPAAVDVDIDPQSKYQLPDGTSIDLSSSFGQDLCQLPELLFSEKLPFIDETLQSDNQNLLQTMSNVPLHKLVHESLLSVGDVDIRKELAGNICLTGGCSLLPNIETRLSQELSNILPAFVKPKVVASRISVERSCAAWIGGSILTSLGSFQQLWLSKTEYDEYGAAMAIQRFP